MTVTGCGRFKLLPPLIYKGDFITIALRSRKQLCKYHIDFYDGNEMNKIKFEFGSFFFVVLQDLRVGTEQEFHLTATHGGGLSLSFLP